MTIAGTIAANAPILNVAPLDVLVGFAVLNAASPPLGGDAGLIRYDSTVYSIVNRGASRQLTNVLPKRDIENTQYVPKTDTFLVHFVYPGHTITLVFGEELKTGVCP